jgi:hypothetical protein
VGSISESPDDWSVIDQGTVADGAVTKAKLASDARDLTATSTKVSAYTVVSADEIVKCDSSGGAFTVTLPTAASYKKPLTIVKVSSDFTGITIDGNGSETINGALTIKIHSQYESVTLVSDGSNWFIQKRSIPSTWTEVTSYGATVTGSSSNPTFSVAPVASCNSFWGRRVGANLEFRVQLRWTTAGAAAGTGKYLFPIPSTFGTIDTNKVLGYTGTSATDITNHVGNGSLLVSSTHAGWANVVVHNSSNVSLIGILSTAPGGTFFVGGNTGSGSAGHYSFNSANTGYVFWGSVPMSGWAD